MGSIKKVFVKMLRIRIFLLISFFLRPNIVIGENLSDSLKLLKAKLLQISSSLAHPQKTEAENLEAKGIPFPLGLIDANKKIPNWETLITDIKEYTTSNTDHAGHPFQHMMWVEQTVSNWFSDNKKHKTFWTDGLESLSERTKKIISLAAFFHDIGKCGDQKYDYYTKSSHQHTGSCFIINKKNRDNLAYVLGITGKRYILKNNTEFDFDAIFTELGITEHERNFITLIIAMHHEFGSVMSSNGSENAIKNYVEKAQKIAQAIEYINDNGFIEKGIIKKPLILLCILITATDVFGSQPQTGDSSLLFGTFHYQKPIHLERAGSGLWIDYRYAEKGPNILKKVIDFLNKKD